MFEGTPEWSPEGTTMAQIVNIENWKDARLTKELDKLDDETVARDLEEINRDEYEKRKRIAAEHRRENNKYVMKVKKDIRRS